MPTAVTPMALVSLPNNTPNSVSVIFPVPPNGTVIVSAFQVPAASVPTPRIFVKEPLVRLEFVINPSSVSTRVILSSTGVIILGIPAVSPSTSNLNVLSLSALPFIIITSSDTGNTAAEAS